MIEYKITGNGKVPPYNCWIGLSIIGYLAVDEAGLYQWWPNITNPGCIPEWVLRSLADKLKDLNSDYDWDM